ncbi:MAG: AAA family ATPase [Polyangiaceae bacterium]
MDPATLIALQAALASSPNNHDLLSVVCAALLESGDARRALEHLDRAELGQLDQTGHRVTFAKVLYESGQFERALGLLDGASELTPDLFLVKARVLDRLDRQEDAQKAYERAIHANPTLQDVELEQRLAAFAAKPQGNGPRLRVISNDDTSDADVVRFIAPDAKKLKFDDVGGLSDVKRQIEKRIILPFKKPSLFQKFKKRVGGGILMYGPPGCGKTLLARATAGECDASFINVAIADILDMYIGESERKLSAIFARARASTPTVLFFDELEALAGKRQFSREGSSAKLVSSFLSEMDGFAQNNSGVLILGATNTPWAVDPAFRRPGRFDRVLFVPPPDREARERILEILLQGRPAGDLKLGVIAERTSTFSGADLEHLVDSASDHAIEESLESGEERPILQSHLVEALEDVKPTTLEWLTTARNYARYANEAGHYDDVLKFLEKHKR